MKEEEYELSDNQGSNDGDEDEVQTGGKEASSIANDNKGKNRKNVIKVFIKQKRTSLRCPAIISPQI